MNPRKTILWFVLAAGLFAFIFFYQRNVHPAPKGPDKVLPELRPEAVTSISIRPNGPGQLQIRADRTNGTWQLSQPLLYRAQAERIQKLLGFLEQLRPAPYIGGSELRAHPNADADYGFAAPQATIVIQQGDYMPRVRVGAFTNPGDQVFLQIEGDLGAYVVDAELLKYIPGSANDWRDTTLLNVAEVAFDRVAVTNNAKGDAPHGGLPASSCTLMLQCDSTNRLWRMVWPLDARANNARIKQGLNKLQEVRIRQFVSDDPKTDLEPLGLAPAELELGLCNGTNVLATVQFGRSPTNEPGRVYARRPGQTGIFTVDKNLLLPWCAFLNDFRDPHLISIAGPVDLIELVRGEERSSVQHQSDGSWQVLPGGFSADTDSISALLSSLTNLQVIQFVNDVVNPADLPEYGLAPPLYHLSLAATCPGTDGSSSNKVIAELDFGLGTNLFAKRSDESFVYAISTNDFARLPSASWQLRDRKLCQFAMTDVTGLTLRQHGKVSQLVHKGPLSWSFAPGSQGILNDAAIEETVRGVIQIAAIVWAAHGQQNRASYGFVDDGLHLTLSLKSGGEFDIEFGGEAPSGNIYAAVIREGRPWILEFPWLLYRDIDAYLPVRQGR